MLKITLYGIPSAVADNVRSFLSASVWDWLWRVFVIAVLLVAVYVLAAMGVVGGIIASILVSTIFADDIRAIWLAIWRRDWAEVSLPW